MRKFIVFIMVIMLGFNTLQSSAQEKNTVDNASITEIKEVVEAFYETYELAYDNYIIDGEKTEQFIDEDSKAFLKLVKSVLNRRILLSKENPFGEIKEINKEVSFSYSNIEIKGKKAVVDVSVHKKFNYNTSPDILTEFFDDYTIELKCTNDWKIVKIDGFIDSIIKHEFEEKSIDLTKVEDLERYDIEIENEIMDGYEKLKSSIADMVNIVESNSMPFVLTATTYNRLGAKNYAVTWAESRNPNYADFENLGGDCTNFISQCLNEGGGIPEDTGTAYSTTDWFYTTSSNRSATWTGAKQFNSYVKSSNSKINISLKSYMSEMDYGDIIQLKNSSGEAYHSLIVTGIVRVDQGIVTDLLFCAHTSNRKNASLVALVPSSTSRDYIKILGGL